MTTDFILIWFWGWSAVLTMVLASIKGHSGAAWFFIGAAAGPISLLAAIGLPDREERPSGD